MANERGYISNMHPGSSIAAQREAMAGVDPIYVDELGPAARRRKDTAALKQRAVLLRPTSRAAGETIKVLGLPVLARGTLDLVDVLAKAAARNATILVMDTGLTLAPGADAATVHQAAADLEKAWRSPGLGKGRELAGERKIADTMRRIELIRADWPKPDAEFTTPELLLRAGPRKGVMMAPATAKRHLDSRPEVQRAYAIEQAREAGRAAAREKRKLERIKGDEK